MEFFPIFLKLRQQPCLVVGGGEVALRKARLLLAAGAALKVAAPELAPELAELAAAGELEHLPRRYEPAMLDGLRLAVAATDDADTNRRVAADAEARGVLVNVVDDAESSRYISPAVIDRSPLMVAVASGGSVPVLARSIRARLESLIPAGYGRLARFGASFRDAVKARFPDVDARRRFWETALEGPLADMVMNGDEEAARAEMARRIATDAPDRAGAVYLVGAGPGNPDLLTFRALRLMQQADVVLYDKLVAPELLQLVRRDAERIYVGKARANHALPQDDINQLLVDLARQGKRVLRLKGGDPFTFGRGGEEIATLAEQGIAFEV
ncbi:siroheme synthase CysG, partial [Chromobacterium phragmitis]